MCVGREISENKKHQKNETEWKKRVGEKKNVGRNSQLGSSYNFLTFRSPYRRLEMLQQMSPSCEHQNCSFLIYFLFLPTLFDSFLKPVQSITCWGQPRYPAQTELFSSRSLSPSLFVLLCHTPIPVKFQADPEGDAGPASSSIQLLFPEPRSCSNHRNCIQRAGFAGGAQKDAQTNTRGR